MIILLLLLILILYLLQINFFMKKLYFTHFNINIKKIVNILL